MMRILLLALLLFLIIGAGQAQNCTPPACVGTDLPLALSCADACILCDLDGYTETNSVGFNTVAPPQFCAQVNHNILWIGFVAGTPNLSFRIDVYDCEDNNGLQIGTYGTTDCMNFTAVTNCEGAVPLTATFTNTVPLVPGQTYYLVIDGNNADVCTFDITVLSGSTAVNPPVGPPPPVDVPDFICPGGTLTFGLGGAGEVPNAGFYDWTINGQPAGCEVTGTYMVPPNSVPGSTLNVCYTASNPCHPPLPQVCETVTVQPLPTLQETATICEGDTYNFYNQIITPPASGTFTYTTNQTLPSGCVQPIALTLTVIAPVMVDVIDEVCQEDLPYFVGGQQISPPPTPGTTGFFSVPLVSAATGCDSIVNLELTVHPTYRPPFGPPIILNEAICEGGSVQVGNTTYGPNLSPQPEPYLFEGIQLTSSNGCDSVVNLILQVFEVPTPQTFTETICEGEFYELGGAFYDDPGIYSATLVSAGGCDSIVTVNLNVYYDPNTEVNSTICNGSSVTIGTQTFSSSGNYSIPLQSELGCDSTVLLNLNVLPPIDTTLFIGICEGETYTVGSTTYDATGTYSEMLTAANGCDSVVYLDLTVYPENVTDLDETICFGETFAVGDSTYTESGFFPTILQSSEGCDSTVNLTLTVQPLIQDTLTADICEGETYEVGNTSVYNSTGFYVDTLTAANGCDSLVYLDLTVEELPETYLDIAVCSGESYTIGNATYTTTGQYTEILTAANGCDSLVYLDLQVIEAFETFLNREICPGITFTVGTSVYSEAGNYIDTLTASIGCDSIVYLNLSVSDILADSLSITICEGSSYILGSTAYNTSGNYEESFVTAEGCDSIAYLALTVLPNAETFLTPAICDGETYTVGTSTYTATGSYVDTLVAANGCDSVVFLDLTVLDVPVTNLTEAICDGETYTVGTSVYNLPGSYADTLTAANGCDSIVNLDLTVLNVPVTNLTEAICDGETYVVGTSVYGTPGSYVDTLTAANGCDSIVFLDLAVLNVPVTNIDTLICEGESLTVGSSVYTAGGMFADTLTAANGCDSIVFLDLTVFQPPVTNLVISICEGSSYTVGSSTYDMDGVYTDTLTASVGCDSIVILDLSVTDFYQTPLNVTLCEGEDFKLGGNLYDSTGVYTETFLAADGCDSIVTLNLTVLPVSFTNLDIIVCQGESVTVGSSVYDTDGAYIDTLTAANGCDSIVDLKLTVLPTFETTLEDKICDGETYSVGASAYTETGFYIDTLTAANGCDSIVKLDLTVYPVPLTGLTETICFGDTFTVGSSVYNTTGVFVDTLTAFTGCDSIVTLDLTVLDLIETDFSETICFGDTYTVGSSIYDSTGFYVDTLTAANGCDSIVRLDLLELDLIETNLIEVICAGESITIGNATYTETGLYQEVLLSQETGCDSIVNLDLTVNPTFTTNLTEAICDGETYQVGSSAYTDSGAYVDTLTAVNGCDSVVFLNLTANEIPETFLSEVLCFGDTYTVGASTYDATGQYVDTLTAFTGCDSIVYLDLTVDALIETDLTEVICFGDTYAVGASVYDATGFYVDTLAAANGCDSIVRLDLTERLLIETDQAPVICEGESVTVGTGSLYETTGFYVDTLVSLATGCDSIVRTDLTVIPTVETFLAEAICNGESFAVGSSVYTQSGQYEDLLSSVSSGCDSIVYLDLTVHPIPETNLVESICEGESYAVGASVYDASGTYTDILTAYTGCDSIVNLDLTVIPTAETFLTQAICDGETYQVGSSLYTESGQYQDVLASAITGCDSIVYLDLTVNPVYETFLSEDICDDESFTVGSQSFSTAGSYEVMLSSSDGCDSLVLLDLATHPCALELTLNAFDAACNGAADGSLSLRMLVGTPPYDYQWQGLGNGLSGTGVIDANNQGVTIGDLPAGVYQVIVTDSYGIESVVTATVGQPAPLIVSLSPATYAGDYNISCPGEADGMVMATAGGGTAPYSYVWSTGDTGAQLSGVPTGNYQVMVTDQNGCEAMAEVTLTAPPPLQATVSTVDPPCYGDLQGRIQVDSVTGGVGPYLYALDNGAFSSNRLFANLDIGVYQARVQDANGCIWEKEVVVNQPAELIVDLGEDLFIKQGEVIQLDAQVNLPVDTFLWTTRDSLSCLDCPDPTSRPLNSTSYSVTVIDANGCYASDDINVFVEKPYEVFIPNVFSPDGDGTNDVLMVFAGPDVFIVRSFRVFNRWGETMFELYNFDANDPLFGWTGEHRGQIMNAGVYVYIAEVEFIDGHVELFYGDALLMK